MGYEVNDDLWYLALISDFFYIERAPIFVNFIILTMQTQPFTTSTFEINEASIVQCFINIHNPSSSPQVRKQADTSLI